MMKMKKLFFVMFILLLTLTCCKKNSNRNKIYAELKQACENVVDLELKGLEVYPNATDLFKQYKEEKIKLVLKAFDESNYSEEVKKLKEITTAFNKLTLDEDSFSFVERGIETNPYIDLFNSFLLKEIVMSAEENEIIELDKIKCIYLY